MIRGLLSNQNMNIVTNIITENINTGDFEERLISSKYRKNELSF